MQAFVNILYVNINICLAMLIVSRYWILEKYVQYENIYCAIWKMYCLSS